MAPRINSSGIRRSAVTLIFATSFFWCAARAQTPKEAVQRDVGTNNLTGSATGAPVKVATITALKAVAVARMSSGQQVEIAGYYLAGDGAGGVFQYNSGSSASDNGGTIIAPTSGSGRWLRVYSSDINVRWFGAKGDASQDDSPYIQAAISAGSKVFIPSGTYRCDSAVALASNTVIYGQGAATILKAATNGQQVLTATSVSNIQINDIAINGGGQTSDIYSGVRGVVGVYLNGVTYFTLRNINITKCGVARSSTPTSDNGYGGYGILIEARSGASGYGNLIGCVVTQIAGGGNFSGDGIYVAGYNASASITTRNVNVIGCYVSTVGRHCYTVAGGPVESVGKSIVFTGCYGEKAALCGVDVEIGDNVRIEDSTFSACGNNQTYFNPASEYGATYRLLAAVASTNENIDLTLDRLYITGCYYGITYGSGDGFIISKTKVELSTVSDLSMSLAGGPKRWRMSESTFMTNASFLLTYTPAHDDTVIVGCDFAGQPIVTGTRGMVFAACVFRAGFQIGADVRKITWTDSTWRDFAGAGISFTGISTGAQDCAVLGCRFVGSGTMTDGILFQFDTAVRWKIEGCEFTGQTTAGIRCTNGNGGNFLASVQRNTFVSCASGLVVTQQGLINANISGNYFESITGWCLDFGSIASTGAFLQNTLANNVAGASCTNGMRLTVSTGSWDWSLVLGNNWHNCSGTKTAIDPGNGNGASANNITT
jgi:hypothetical protein